MNIDCETRPCCALWSNVLTRAIMDIFAPVTSNERRLERDQAIAWVGSPDFFRVCELAMRDGTKEAARIRKRLEQQATGEFDFSAIAPYARRYLAMEVRG